MASRYKLDDLGWYQFEWLCQSLLKSILGVAVEAWGGHSDLGRDAYYSGSLKLTKDNSVDGPFVFQAKFMSGANAAGAKVDDGLLKAVRAECVASQKRLTAGTIKSPQQYILITNAPVSAGLKAAIEKEFHTVFPLAQVRTWHSADLDAMLDNAPHIRQTFPQLLGLRDLKLLLSEVVQKPILERSTLGLERAEELAQVFVPTLTYNAALTVLIKHHFVVLTGPPEMGKTAIARMIGLAKHSQGWDYYECRSPNDFFHAVERAKLDRDPGRKQIFVADDAFGSTEYRLELAQAWGSDLDYVLRSLDKTHWMIWTSRPAPLATALTKMHLQGLAERFPTPAEVMVDASKLTKPERALILYRHSKAAALSDYHKETIRKHAISMMENLHFTPERVRRFVRDRLPNLTSKSDWEFQQMISKEIADPTESMRKSLHCLDSEHQKFLVALLDGRSGAREASEVHNTYRSMFAESADKEPDFLAKDLKDHFVRISKRPHQDVLEYDWIHPSWRDLVIELLLGSRLLRQTFLKGCSTYGILLALSTAGGGIGERKTPLLTVQGDWDILRLRLPVLINMVTDYNLGLLLAAIRHAARAKVSDSDRGPLKELTALAVECCQARWIAAIANLSYGTIELYKEACKYAKKTPKLPSLVQSTINRILEAQSLIEEASEEFHESVFDDLDESISFAELVKENEGSEFESPALTKYLTQLAHGCQGYIKAQLNWDVDATSVSMIESEIDRYKEFQKFVVRFAKLSPALTTVLDSTTKLLQREIDRQQEKIDEWDEEEDDDDQSATSQQTSEFDLQSLFIDL